MGKYKTWIRDHGSRITGSTFLTVMPAKINFKLLLVSIIFLQKKLQNYPKVMIQISFVLISNNIN